MLWLDRSRGLLRHASGSQDINSHNRRKYPRLPQFDAEAGDGLPCVIEDIGYDFVPDILSRSPEVVDHWIKASDAAAKLLIEKEGSLVGGGSGSLSSGALSWLKTEARKNIVDTEGSNVMGLSPNHWVPLW